AGLRDAPLRPRPSFDQNALQRGIERSLLGAEDAGGEEADALRDGVSVQGPAFEHAKDEHVERAFRHRNHRHRKSRYRTEGTWCQCPRESLINSVRRYTSVEGFPPGRPCSCRGSGRLASNDARMPQPSAKTPIARITFVFPDALAP